jgi:hypothetical protein
MRKIEKQCIVFLLALLLFFNSVFLPSQKTFASTVPTGDYTFSDWRDKAPYEVWKFVLYIASICGATIMNGDYEQAIKDTVDYAQQQGAGTFEYVHSTSSGVTYDDELVKIISNYFESQKDSSSDTGYKSDSGLTEVNYRFVKTQTYSYLWKVYYDGYLDDMKPMASSTAYEVFDSFEDFEKLCLDEYILNNIAVGSEYLQPKSLGLLCINPCSSPKNYYFYSEPYTEYYGKDVTTRIYYIGDVDAGTLKWSVAPRKLTRSVASDGSYSYKCDVTNTSYNSGFFMFEWNGTSLSMKANQSSLENTNSSIGKSKANFSYLVQDESYFPFFATEDGSWIRLFASDDDARNYYSYMDSNGLSVPTTPYSGGNVTINTNNGTIIYGDVVDDSGGSDDDSGGGSSSSDDDSGGGIFSSIVKGVISALKGVLEALLSVLSTVLDFVADAIKLVTNTLSDAKELLNNGFTSFLTELFPFIPKEWITAITLGLGLMVFGVFLKMFK